MGGGSTAIDLPIHDFNKYLDRSNSLANRQFFDSCYRSCFPTLERVIKIDDISRQKNGLDVFLILKDNMAFTVEEKYRFDNWYDDLLIEYRHDFFDDRPSKEGWIYTSVSQFLAYGSLDFNKFYIYNFLDLKKAWLMLGNLLFIIK